MQTHQENKIVLYYNTIFEIIMKYCDFNKIENSRYESDSNLERKLFAYNSVLESRYKIAKDINDYLIILENDLNHDMPTLIRLFELLNKDMDFTNKVDYMEVAINIKLCLLYQSINMGELDNAINYISELEPIFNYRYQYDNARLSYTLNLIKYSYKSDMLLITSKQIKVLIKNKDNYKLDKEHIVKIIKDDLISLEGYEKYNYFIDRYNPFG